MSASLYGAISGLNANQQLLNVTSQNLANANTVGYKSQSVNFSQMLETTLSGASAPTATTGGVDPEQLASGGAVQVSSTDVNMSQGGLQTTGVPTNLAVEGSGFFVVKGSQGTFYTRSGDFSLDANGDLVDPNGNLVQGWMANAQGQVTANPTALTAIKINQGQAIPPQATTSITYSGNLNAGDTVGQTHDVPVTVYNSLGNPVQIDLTLTNKGPVSGGQDEWSVADGTTNLGTLTFNTAGNLVASSSTLSNITVPATSGAASMTLSVDMSGLTQYSSTSTVQASNQSGYSSGTLENFTINPNGSITGSFSNGQTMNLGQVALAGFNNSSGLVNAGNNLWSASNNSGTPQVGIPGSAGLGSLNSGSLEESNVSMSGQLINLVIAQQGYQANAKVITVDQTLGQSEVNMVQ